MDALDSFRRVSQQNKNLEKQGVTGAPEEPLKSTELDNNEYLARSIKEMFDTVKKLYQEAHTMPAAMSSMVDGYVENMIEALQQAAVERYIPSADSEDYARWRFQYGPVSFRYSEKVQPQQTTTIDGKNQEGEGGREGYSSFKFGYND